MKTYATLGPACCRADLLTELLDMGLTGFRLNMSHTTLTACRPWTEAVQQARQASGRDAELIIDMRGPELRMGARADTGCLLQSHTGRSLFYQ